MLGVISIYLYIFRIKGDNLTCTSSTTIYRTYWHNYRHDCYFNGRKELQYVVYLYEFVSTWSRLMGQFTSETEVIALLSFNLTNKFALSLPFWIAISKRSKWLVALKYKEPLSLDRQSSFISWTSKNMIFIRSFIPTQLIYSKNTFIKLDTHSLFLDNNNDLKVYI